MDRPEATRPGVRRAAAVLLGVVGAFAIGGVAQAHVWAGAIHWLTAVSNSQFLWALLCFVVAWAWSLGRLLPGAAAGALTGLALIASYYAVQWLVSGQYSAVVQFTNSRGLAWTVASVLGGAGVGLLGALAGQCAATRPRRKAFGMIGAGLLVGCGPAVWKVSRGGYFLSGELGVAVAVFIGVGVVLVTTAFWCCGPRNAIRGGLPAVLVAAGLLAVLFILQNAGILYLTF